jgi:hypothetical protein
MGVVSTSAMIVPLQVEGQSLGRAEERLTESEYSTADALFRRSRRSRPVAARCRTAAIDH